MEIAIIIAAIILCATILTVTRQQLRSKERRSLIEKGLDPSLINIYTSSAGKNIFLFGGIILLGGGYWHHYRHPAGHCIQNAGRNKRIYVAIGADLYRYCTLYLSYPVTGEE